MSGRSRAILPTVFFVDNPFGKAIMLGLAPTIIHWYGVAHAKLGRNRHALERLKEQCLGLLGWHSRSLIHCDLDILGKSADEARFPSVFHINLFSQPGFSLAR
jgi:hypothetical protein